VASVGVSAAVAPATKARVLPWHGTLTIESFEFRIPTFTTVDQGLATVNASAGLGALDSLRGAGGFTGTQLVTTSASSVFPLLGVEEVVGLGTGTVGPISGGRSPLAQGTLPLGGQIRLCLLNKPCQFYVPFTLTADGTRGVGIGGLVTLNGFGTAGVKVSVQGAPWTIATAVVTNGFTPNGAQTPTTASRRGFAHGPASGSSSTGRVGGVVQLVTPIQVTSTLLGQTGFIASLRWVLVPEPGTASLLGAGAAALAWLGRRRLSKRAR
jgi:hypothetical protein